jgi:hypothetical protein
MPLGPTYARVGGSRRVGGGWQDNQGVTITHRRPGLGRMGHSWWGWQGYRRAWRGAWQAPVAGRLTGGAGDAGVATWQHAAGGSRPPYPAVGPTVPQQPNEEGGDARSRR